MTDIIAASDRPRMMRALRVAIGGVVIELGLLIIREISPAMRGLLRPIYVLVAVIFLFAIWQAARQKRTGHDRRQTDRRGRADGE